MSYNFMMNMTGPQVEELAKTTKLAFLPIGPVEVHSTHLSLGTDVDSAMESIERACAKLEAQGISSLVAPPINYAVAEDANMFYGNMTARASTISAIVSDGCVALAKWGFTDVAVICAHGEPKNRDAIAEGIKDAEARAPWMKTAFPDFIFKSNIGPVMKCENPAGDIHAGEIETSLMLMRRPETVDMDALAKLGPSYYPNFWDRKALNHNFAEAGVWNCLIGDPTVATAETGAKIYDIYADALVTEVLAKFDDLK